MIILDRDQLIKDLERDEGFVPHVYQDTLSFWTIGYGFMVDQRKGGQIPRDVADYWLEYLVRNISSELDARLPWLADQPEPVVRALHNMAYQMGVRGLLNFRRMLAALEAGNRTEAAREALNSRWATQTPNRAQRIADLIRGKPL